MSMLIITKRKKIQNVCLIFRNLEKLFTTPEGAGILDMKWYIQIASNFTTL
jgi:hypothetical protein